MLQPIQVTTAEEQTRPKLMMFESVLQSARDANATLLRQQQFKLAAQQRLTDQVQGQLQEIQMGEIKLQQKKQEIAFEAESDARLEGVKAQLKDELNARDAARDYKNDEKLANIKGQWQVDVANIYRSGTIGAAALEGRALNAAETAKQLEKNSEYIARYYKLSDMNPDSNGMVYVVDKTTGKQKYLAASELLADAVNLKTEYETNVKRLEPVMSKANKSVWIDSANYSIVGKLPPSEQFKDDYDPNTGKYLLNPAQISAFVEKSGSDKRYLNELGKIEARPVNQTQTQMSESFKTLFNFKTNQVFEFEEDDNVLDWKKRMSAIGSSGRTNVTNEQIRDVSDLLFTLSLDGKLNEETTFGDILDMSGGQFKLKGYNKISVRQIKPQETPGNNNGATFNYID
jgi:hypothetical protein